MRSRKEARTVKSIKLSGLVSRENASRQQQKEGYTIDRLYKLNQKNITV